MTPENDRDELEEVLKAFWHGRQDRVVEAVKRCASPELGGFLSEKFIRHARYALKLDPTFIPSSRTIDRLNEGQKGIRSCRHVTGAFLTMTSILASRAELPDDMTELLPRFAAVMAELQEILGEQFPKCDSSKLLLASKVQPKAPPPILDMLYEYLNVTVAQFREMTKEFFPDISYDSLPAIQQEKHYNMYRFHSDPGRVVKTFTVIKSPTQSRPFCMFSNFFVNKDIEKPRRSNGIIIPARKYMYFIGGLKSGAGLKIMVTERNEHLDGSYHGLVTTFDETDAIVAARTLIVPTAAADHKDAKAGIYSMREIDAEIRSRLDEIRNHIPFELEQTLKWEGKNIKQEQMVGLVSEQLGGAVNPKLTGENGDAFNPADEEYYTFNAALKAWAT
ncbi:MAG TPA: hypothetical protein VHZ29_04670 [Rhizomicrobium sp.]|jgi:hypothetical protein|nr:hypothetical protein [Rhizomicrobium sp.]